MNSIFEWKFDPGEFFGIYTLKMGVVFGKGWNPYGQKKGLNPMIKRGQSPMIKNSNVKN